MPTVNIYYSKKYSPDEIAPLLPLLRERVAQQLTGVERKLVPEEVSIRPLSVDAAFMIAPLEIEIKAQSYPSRVERIDEICLRLREFVLEHAVFAADASVWLQLSELGHSFVDTSVE